VLLLAFRALTGWAWQLASMSTRQAWVGGLFLDRARVHAIIHLPSPVVSSTFGN